MHNKLWTLHIKVVPVILGIALILTGFFSISSIISLQGNARVINYTGIVRGATQRLVKKELNRMPDDGLVDKLDEIIRELSQGEEKNHIIKLESDEYQALLAQMQLVWQDLKDEILRFRAGGPPQPLYLLSEEYFDLADRTVSAAELYTEESVQQALKSLVGMNVVFLLLAVLCGVSAALVQKRQERLLDAENANRKKSEQLSKMLEDIRAPMNEISELMYVSDLETYDLLFTNNAGRETFHIADSVGQKCYKVLQGLDAPCPFCTTPFLKPGQNYTWEFTNPILNRHFLLKDRLIEWEGRPARMEIAFDMTESENERIELKNMLDGEKVIVECVRELYQNHELRNAVEHVLAHVGRFLQVDRVYIIDFNKESFTNTFEWCKEGVEPEQDKLQNMPIELFKQWRALIQEQDCIAINNIEDLSGELPEVYELLKMQEIQRLVLVPLEYSGDDSSCIGIDNPPLERMHNAVNILQTLRYFLMLASHRARDEAKLAKLSYYDTLTGFYNRNRYIQDLQQISQQKSSIGVVYVDVNGLKEVNDEFGHDMGDALLKECAGHIREVFHGNDLYRIGGDEFVVLCTGIEQDVFLNLVRRLRLRFEEEGEDQCQAAIGAQWSAESACVQATITAADEKMYADKRAFYQERQPKRYRHR